MTDLGKHWLKGRMDVIGIFTLKRQPEEDKYHMSSLLWESNEPNKPMPKNRSDTQKHGTDGATAQGRRGRVWGREDLSQGTCMHIGVTHAHRQQRVPLGGGGGGGLQAGHMYSSQQHRLYKIARPLPQPLDILKGNGRRASGVLRVFLSPSRSLRKPGQSQLYKTKMRPRLGPRSKPPLCALGSKLSLSPRKQGTGAQPK